ncbi:beta-1-3, beta-1-6-glucan biosynthesis protein [Bradyrhizobium manausense]|uniref:beta-1-3, beta-1-6-glucan biosynthesis protein n=1 Tax=Bradyrhizobium manausense TaxID=989370 RepID=UPI001BA5F04B|nr:beta-1-3, beta-1-6-glucan biosynthesis protein [Bradyrhizobium manausense]MBR0721108.1 beta-1-3, beta-1-6-glucan biosynthesis protein [Bradyrhizobium manausense]MBR0835271.1 beta-1-3, beta-1-6-glucan biosynthesis protein [Bradyrhizobium manausense]
MRRRVFELRNAVLRQLAATLTVSSLVLLASLGGASAQSGTPAPDQGKQPAAQATDAAKDANQNQNQKRIDEFAEAARAVNGPAGNPECVWLGRRAVQLMYRDDLDTAFRHIDLYDRFGCPGGHIQAAFRCLTRFLTQIDDKVPNSLNNLTQACWINPAAQPQQTTAAASSPAPAPAAGAAPPQPAASPSPAASPTPAPSK